RRNMAPSRPHSAGHPPSRKALISFTEFRIRLSDAKILWDPAGTVRVVSQSAGPAADDGSLMKSAGACTVDWVKANEKEQLEMLLILFVQLTLSEGLPAIYVHEAFKSINQYREAIDRAGFIVP
ncbi:hypothetical protein, partial [Roseospirillum parvum]|uniref:hypothetical protein n=1 Tax=Roseospirillum parvum TaxID=83401 RepID=UPI001C409DF2